MRNAPFRPTLLLGAALSVLAACTEVPETSAGAASGITQTTTPQTRLTEAEVPRPELYSESGIAVWDGRPSIGAVWVAHPLVEQARRVRITVTETGVSAPGALLKRDPSIPGPPFLLSGDAAARLGVQPGVPARIEVVALERDIVAEPIAETPPPVEPSNEQTSEPAPVVAPETDDPIAPEPEAAEIAETPVDAAIPAEPVTEQPTIAVAASTVPQQIVIPSATRTTTPVVADTTPPRRPYVQVGTFGVRSNADTLARNLRERGYEVRTDMVDGATRPLTRVLIGPAATRAERKVIIDRLRADGITDTLLTNL